MKFHQRVPRSFKANLAFRRSVLTQCQGNPDAQAAALEACRQDPLFWANTFVWTYDPRPRVKFLPFCSWPIQDECITRIIEAVDGRHDFLIEKSRDMGASWCNLIA